MKIIKPSIDLAPFVKYIWILEDVLFGHKELVYPTGEVQMLFHYGEPFKNKDKDDQWSSQPSAGIAGQNTTHQFVSSSGSCGVIAFVFHPYGASPFINIPLSELTDINIAIQDILPAFSYVEEKLSYCKNNEERVSLIEEKLLRVVDIQNIYHYKMIHESIKKIDNADERFLIAHLKDDIGYSSKHYERIFKHHVGISPKMYMQINQLGKAVSLLSFSTLDLTAIAQEAGFYDQSHFIRKFKNFTGFTPGAFKKMI